MKIKSLPSLLLALPSLLMENQESDQADNESGDDLTSLLDGHTVSVIPAEANDTAVDKPKEETLDGKDRRKSDKEWQEMQEKAKKGETAASILENLSKALGVEPESEKEKKVDPLQAVTQKVDELQQKLALSEWEKSHPNVDTPEYREEWSRIVKEKAHLVKSGDLSYDDLWAIIRKGTPKTTTNRDYKDQELRIGSVPLASKTVTTGQEIDPDVHAAMKRRGWSDEQIKSSAA